MARISLIRLEGTWTALWLQCLLIAFALLGLAIWGVGMESEKQSVCIAMRATAAQKPFAWWHLSKKCFWKHLLDKHHQSRLCCQRPCRWPPHALDTGILNLLRVPSFPEWAISVPLSPQSSKNLKSTPLHCWPGKMPWGLCKTHVTPTYCCLLWIGSLVGQHILALNSAGIREGNVDTKLQV